MYKNKGKVKLETKVSPRRQCNTGRILSPLSRACCYTLVERITV